MTDPTPVDPAPTPTPAELDRAVLDASLTLADVLFNSPTDQTGIAAATQQVVAACQARGYE